MACFRCSDRLRNAKMTLFEKQMLNLPTESCSKAIYNTGSTLPYFPLAHRQLTPNHLLQHHRQLQCPPHLRYTLYRLLG